MNIIPFDPYQWMLQHEVDLLNLNSNSTLHQLMEESIPRGGCKIILNAKCREDTHWTPQEEDELRFDVDGFVNPAGHLAGGDVKELA